VKRNNVMLLNYIEAAMHHARYENVPNDGVYYGEIPECNGVYAHANTLGACREELQEVLEEWIVFRLHRHLHLPEIDGIQLSIKKAEGQEL